MACDVTTLFVDAARVFAPQKGATPTQVRLLTSRLERLVQLYRENYGVDVSTIEGAGAAGGLAGGLLALGARLVPGFEMVADEVDLIDRVKAADLVITGEGRLDDTSFEGKVVGGLTELCRSLDKPVAAVVGSIDIVEPPTDMPAPVKAIADLYGIERATDEPLWCIERATLELLNEIRR